MAEEIMSIKEVAEYLGIHEITVYKLVNEGKLPGFKVGGQWRFQKDTLDKWIADEMHTKEVELAHSTGKKIKKILIVDDNPDDIEMISKTIKESGLECEIISTDSGFGAWKEILKVKPDIVILDLKLPDIDGFRICENIRADKDTKGTVILAITAFDAPGIKEKILSAGADGFIIKNYKGDQLSLQVKKLLGI